MRMILSHAAKLIAAGIVLGMVGAFAVTRFLQSMLYEFGTTDPVAFIVVPALLLVVGLLAASIPAGRASRIEPTSALRYQ
jgi:ABC-type lipoprotein release transport system permease subunit